MMTPDHLRSAVFAALRDDLARVALCAILFFFGLAYGLLWHVAGIGGAP